jgi:hypothetical protein
MRVPSLFKTSPFDRRRTCALQFTCACEAYFYANHPSTGKKRKIFSQSESEIAGFELLFQHFKESSRGFLFSFQKGRMPESFHPDS